MRVGWIVGLLMMYVILTPIFGILDNTFYGSTSGNLMWMLMNPPDNLLSILNPMNIWNYASALANALTMNYIFFEGGWIVLRFILLTVGGGFFIAFILSLRGTPSI